MGNGLSDLDAELNFPWGDSTDEKPDGVRSSFKCERNKAANDFVAASEIGLSSDTNHAWTYSAGSETNLDWGFKNAGHDCDDHLRYSWTV
jgi:hypothetical protein